MLNQNDTSASTVSRGGMGQAAAGDLRHRPWLCRIADHPRLWDYSITRVHQWARYAGTSHVEQPWRLAVVMAPAVAPNPKFYRFSRAAALGGGDFS